MKTLNLLTTMSLLVAGFCLTASQATATPLIDTLNVQGYMKKANGTAVSDGTYTMYIGVFQGGSAVWAKQYAVAVTNGLFSQALSSTGTDLSSTAPVGTGMRSDFHNTTLSAALLSGTAASEVMIRVYSATAIDGANPQFDITLGATPTAMVAALAQGVEDGSLTVASLATSAKATAGGSANKSRIPILDSVNGLLDSTMIPALDSTTLTNGSITGSGNVTYKSAAGSTTTIGDNSSTSTTAIQSGTGGISIGVTGATGNISVTPGSTSGTVTVGSSSTSGDMTLQTGSGNLLLAPNTGVVRITKGGINLVNGAGTATINSATSGSWTMTLPTDAGTNKFYLMTDGAGATSWADPYIAPGTIGSTTPNTGAFTTLSVTGQITSSLTTGTAPFVVASTTNVANLNASSLNGATFAAPGAIGGTTPAAGTFTILTADSLTGATNLSLASAVGSTTTVGATSGASPINIGGGSSTGAVTIGQSSGAQDVTIGGGASTGTISIGNSTAAQNITIGGGTGTGAINLGGGTGAQNVTIGNTGAGAATVIQSGSTGKIKVGATGTTFTAMGVCTTGSITVTNSVLANQTCTGVPASTNVAVHCSGSAAFSGATAVLYARANGTADKINLSASAANTTAMTYTCMWVQP